MIKRFWEIVSSKEFKWWPEFSTGIFSGRTYVEWGAWCWSITRGHRRWERN